jgi:hypothetical protein
MQNWTYHGDLRIRVIYAPDEAMMQCPEEIKTHWVVNNLRGERYLRGRRKKHHLEPFRLCVLYAILFFRGNPRAFN